nr:kinetochore-associated protein DSN1 homolog isoform X2 [Oryctolagus cuniculus]
MDGRRCESPPSRMASVTGAETVEEEEPVTSKTHGHPLESNLNPVEASLEMTRDVAKERIHLGSSPEKWASCDLSHQEALLSKSLRLSPQEQPALRQDRRQSWRRASMKETNRRKSLAPFHQGITELSRSISADLAESKRLSCLLLSSFQFSVQKLEPFLKDAEGFSLESFRMKASSLSEELKHFTERLESDGTLQRCFEDSERKASDLSLETSVAEMKEYITKFSSERQTWDQLLLHYQKEAEEMISSHLTSWKRQTHLCLVRGNLRPGQELWSGEFNEHMAFELQMDELQGSVRQLQAFMDESTQCLQKVSVQLEKKSMQQLDSSPARKLLRLHLQSPPTTRGSRPRQ